MGDREWRLWLELWGRAARRPELRAVAAQLYERYDAWIEEVVEEGIGERRIRAPATPRAVTRRLVAMIDGVGLRVLVRRSGCRWRAARRLGLAGWPQSSA